ncbi:exported protein of unknown function [Cupriavidus taiwanensis]|nr:exported protein of unknown function [Cupriavidus taiwanensis]
MSGRHSSPSCGNALVSTAWGVTSPWASTGPAEKAVRDAQSASKASRRRCVFMDVSYSDGAGFCLSRFRKSHTNAAARHKYRRSAAFAGQNPPGQRRSAAAVSRNATPWQVFCFTTQHCRARPWAAGGDPRKDRGRIFHKETET